MTAFAKRDLNRVRRIPQRAHYDRETIYSIVDAAPICHVAFIQEGRPYVIPTIHARLEDSLVLHGAPASRLLKQVATGEELCVAMTLLDGLVLARSVFHHSMNYRSAVLFGHGHMVEDEERKMRALEALTEHVMPGRWRDARTPTTAELEATTVVEIAIDTASAKVRTGGPSDDDEDYALPIWAGIIPIRQQALEPKGDTMLAKEIEVPQYILDYVNSGD